MRLRIISGFVASKNFDNHSLDRMKVFDSKYFLSEIFFIIVPLL